MKVVRFDDSLAIAIRLLHERFGEKLPEVTLVRDAQGQITVVLPDAAMPPKDWAGLAASLHTGLSAFSPGAARVLVRVSDLIDQADVVGSPDRVQLPETQGVWLLDRLLTNQDWLRSPVLARPPLPLATAFSLKGGVGRSTALSVWAWHLARMGQRVLAVDLDLEAPGLGSLLLPALPEFGLVDWLVETLVGQADPQLLEDSLATSPVADGSPGVIRVLPAFGKNTRDYIAKVGRVYLPSVAEDGRQEGISDRIAALIRQLAGRIEPPDVILLDARAGLHDVGAAAVTQLGAEAFVFARDEPQSWRALSLLLEHLRRSRQVRWGMPDDDLRWRLHMVGAQMAPSEGALAAWNDRSYETWSSLYDEEKNEEETGGQAGAVAQTFERGDQNAPHHPLPIYFDSRLQGLDLTSSESRPEWAVVQSFFGGFLEGATRSLVDGPAGDRPSEEAEAE